MLRLLRTRSRCSPVARGFFGIESPTAMARGLVANCQSPVGTGPFVVKQWIHGQSVELEKNAAYISGLLEKRGFKFVGQIEITLNSSLFLQELYPQ